jgi:rhamnogalacturonyl hydrolase YesR
LRNQPKLTKMELTQSFRKLKAFCEKENFKGWDPYDGLNSTVFQSIPMLSKNRIARLAWIQIFKKNPVNLRKIAGVKKDYNSKGLGLFLHGYCNLYKLDNRTEYLEQIRFLADLLLEARSKGYSGSCWGYNFDWQARAFFQPKYTPTVVATTFIAYALMEAYDLTRENRYLEAAVDTQFFILKDLNRTYDADGDFAFSYSPQDTTQVFNASLLGSRLLARIYSYTGDALLLHEAKKSVNFCTKHQKEDGSWSYGTLPFHQWIDNFHSGYNLECIAEYERWTGDQSYTDHIIRGLKYYIDHFFTEKGECKYYHNKLYPIDVHNTSQLIITLSRLGRAVENKQLIDTVLNWTVKHMQDPEGFFYYQLRKGMSPKIPYIRWAQAWMFYGMTEYFLVFHVNPVQE